METSRLSSGTIDKFVGTLDTPNRQINIHSASSTGSVVTVISIPVFSKIVAPSGNGSGSTGGHSISDGLSDSQKQALIEKLKVFSERFNQTQTYDRTDNSPHPAPSSNIWAYTDTGTGPITVVALDGQTFYNPDAFFIPSMINSVNPSLSASYTEVNMSGSRSILILETSGYDLTFDTSSEPSFTNRFRYRSRNGDGFVVSGNSILTDPVRIQANLDSDAVSENYVGDYVFQDGLPNGISVKDSAGRYLGTVPISWPFRLSISVNHSTLVLFRGGSHDLAISTQPDFALVTSFSNPGVASYNPNTGKVTGLTEGSTELIISIQGHPEVVQKVLISVVPATVTRSFTLPISKQPVLLPNLDGLSNGVLSAINGDPEEIVRFDSLANTVKGLKPGSVNVTFTRVNGQIVTYEISVLFDAEKVTQFLEKIRSGYNTAKERPYFSDSIPPSRTDYWLDDPVEDKDSHGVFYSNGVWSLSPVDQPITGEYFEAVNWTDVEYASFLNKYTHLLVQWRSSTDQGAQYRIQYPDPIPTSLAHLSEGGANWLPETGLVADGGSKMLDRNRNPYLTISADLDEDSINESYIGTIHDGQITVKTLDGEVLGNVQL